MPRTLALFWAPHMRALYLVSTWKQGVALTADAEHEKGPGAPAWVRPGFQRACCMALGPSQYMAALYLQLWISRQPVPFTQGQEWVKVISYSGVTISHPAHLKEILLMKQKFQPF